jgi:threonine dehydratase
MLTLPDVLASRSRIAADIRTTPLVESHWLSALTGADVRLKLESLQVCNTFKARGALNALRRLVERHAGAGLPQVVTASAGNHGRGIAWAAERCGLHATIFTPHYAPRAKLDAIARHGADLRAVAPTYEESERLALEHAKATGAIYVSPYNDDDVIAGAGTTAVEILEHWPDVDVVVAPVGGGGLISGVAVAVKGMKPSALVIGAEAEASPVFTSARAAGRLVHVDVQPTIADGLAGNAEDDTRTWAYVRDLVNRVVAMPEADLRAGVRSLLAEEHLVAEGAGVAGIAAVAAGLTPRGRRTAIVVSGSNIDLSRLEECL